MVNPYYVNESSVYAVAIIFPILGFVGVALRLYARKHKKAGFGADDVMSVIALILTIWCAAIMIYGDAAHTIGWHSPKQTASASWMATLESRTRILSIIEWVFILTSVLAIGAIRLIFALLYRRIFHQHIFQFYRIANWIIIGFIVAWTVTFFLANLFQCGTHFDVMWTSQADYAKYCPGSFKIAMAMALSDVVIDFALLITPIVPVLQLNMPTHEKIIVVGMFALGIFSIAAGMTRLVLVGEVMTYKFGSSEKLFGLAGTADQIGVVSVEIWWTFVEIGVGMLVSQLPVVAGLLRGKWRNPLQSFMSRFTLTSLRTSRSRSTRENSHTSSMLEQGKSQYNTTERDDISE